MKCNQHEMTTTTTTTTTTTIIKSFPDVLVDVIAAETASVDVEEHREMMSAVSINFTISLFFLSYIFRILS